MEFIPCTLKQLPDSQRIAAAATAIGLNPVNGVSWENLSKMVPGLDVEPQHISLLVSKYWGSKGVHLGVAFLDNPPADLRARIISHANAWSKTANVQFVETSLGNAQVRLARSGTGYWSYLGTDILHIPQGQPTLNLQDFTMQTPDKEFYRVVRHEFGHTCGFVHEHLRSEIVFDLDIQKTLLYFETTQGWSAAEVQAQVLTPLDESQLKETPHADRVSVMCYQLPASITKSGQPIPGGNDIDEQDYAFAALVYPKSPVTPPVNPPPVGGELAITLPIALPAGTYVRRA